MNIEKIKLMDTYISKNNTGRSKDFASKINISRGMLYRYLRYMKEELNAPIIYSKQIESYQYSEKGNLYIQGWQRSLLQVANDALFKERNESFSNKL